MRTKGFLYIGILGLMMPVLLNAQDNTVYQGKVKIMPHELAQRGDSLYVNLDMHIDGTALGSIKTMDIIPVLTDGVQSKDLPKVTIKGKRSYKEYMRRQALMSKKEKAAHIAPYTVERSHNNSNTINYKYVLHYESWMEGAHLNAKSDLCGCGTGARQVAMERLIDNVSIEKVIEPYQVKPYLAYVDADADIIVEEKVKRRDMSNESFLDFAVGKTDIRPEFGSNPNELTKIHNMIASIRGDRGVTIRSIDITGYASPEGALAANKRLSEDRAKALSDYLQTRFEIPKKDYNIHFGGEDWDGLVQRIELSEMSNKQDVLDIINNTVVVNDRKAKLKSLAGGVPYAYMLKNIYPSLRRVLCKVNYDVKNFDLNEAKEVMKTRPQNLSLKEMYMVAETYEKGSQEYSDVFETAVRLFPEDRTANVNAAAATLARRDIVSAERYLNKVQSNDRIPEYDNAMGVLEMLKGNYDKAEKHLNIAKRAGISVAQQNLDEIAKKREDMKRIGK